MGIEGNCQFATPLRNEKTGEFEFPVERAKKVDIIKDEVSEKSQPCRTENTTFVLDESARITQPLPHTYVLFELLSSAKRENSLELKYTRSNTGTSTPRIYPRISLGTT